MQVSYHRVDSTVIDRLINPLDLVAKGSVWYLFSRSSRRGCAVLPDLACAQCHNHRLSLRPVEFDLAKYWQQPTTEFKASLPRYVITVRVAPELLPWLRYAGRFARIE